MGQTVFPGLKTFKPGMNELRSLTPVGNYGVQASWADGHDTGIYSWDYLHDLGKHQAVYWEEYLRRLDAHGESREPKTLIKE